MVGQYNVIFIGTMKSFLNVTCKEKINTYYNIFSFEIRQKTKYSLFNYPGVHSEK